MNEQQFQEAMSELRKIFGRVVADFIKAAPILGRMIRPELRRVEKAFPQVDRHLIRRLHLLGQGVMAEHLAVKTKSVSATWFTSLDPRVRACLNDPDQIVEIYDDSAPEGRRTKRVADCEAGELMQVAAEDYNEGLLTPKQQADRTLGRTAKPSRVDLSECEELDRIVVADSHWLVAFGVDGSKIKMKISALNKRFGR